METNNRSIQNFNEVIFENRNRSYGAYAIRKSHSDSVTKSLLITSLLFGLLVVMVSFYNKGKDKMPDMDGNIPLIDSVFVMEVDLTPEKIPEEIKPEKKTEQEVPKSDNLDYEPDDDAEQKESKPNSEAVVVAGGNEKGSDSIPSDIIPETVTVKKPVVTTGPVYAADVDPKFDGDAHEFIRSRLRYPEIAKENGTQGVVGLSFVIEKDGSIANIKTLSEVPDGCTEEAIRVLKLMPKWKPGMIKGEAVSVYVTLPIKFRLK